MHPVLDNYFNLIRKLIPTKTESTAIGVDIGVHEVKMVELSKDGDDYKLINWSIEKVKGGDVNAAIAAVVHKSTISPKNIVVSVYGKGTLIRYIDMPCMSIEELRNSFAIEADKYFPFSQEQIFTDCYILDSNGKGKTMRVLAAAAKKEIVQKRLESLTALGLQSNFVSLNPIAIANVFHELGLKEDKDDSKIKAVFDFGESVSSLTVLVGGLPKFNRDIYIGGRELTKRIGNAMGIEFEDAEKLKCNPGEKLPEIKSACDSLLTNLMQELRLSFDYFSTENSLKVDELYVTGGSSKLVGFEEILSENLEIPIHIWNPFESIQTAMSEQDKNENASKLGVALGLAMYNYD